MKPCKCHNCKPVLEGIRADISPLRNTPAVERPCIAASPCIDPGSVECACPGPGPAPETILEEAQRLVHGNRGADYGHPIVDYERTGRMWGAILGIPDIDPRICCLMMVAVKLSREVNKHKRDNLVDAAGYSECASMVADEQRKRANSDGGR